MIPFLCQSVSTFIVLYKWLCPGALFWQRNYSLSCEVELAAYVDTRNIWSYKILGLQACIFSADSIKKEFTLISLVRRDVAVSPCLSSEDVFVTQILPSVVRYHEGWGQDRVFRQCSWEAGSEGLVGCPAASALVCITPGSLGCLEMSVLSAPRSGPFRVPSLPPPIHSPPFPPNCRLRSLS